MQPAAPGPGFGVPAAAAVQIPDTVGARYPRHDGSAAGADDDLLVPPDPAIGEVISAVTNRTLRGFHKRGTSARIQIAVWAIITAVFGGVLGAVVAGAGFGAVADALDVDVDPALRSILGLAGGFVGLVGGALFAILLPMLLRRRESSYVGKAGVQRYSKGRLGGPRREVLPFDAADELKVARTRHFTNGSYTGTNYDYSFFKSGRRVLAIAGRYNDKRPTDPLEAVQLGVAAERAWTRHRLAQVQVQIARDGVARFRSGQDFIGVGDGFIEIGWKGAVERLSKAEIQALTLQKGTLVVKRQGAKEGLFRSEGVFRFPVAALADFRTFLVALEVCTGYRFD